METTEIGPLNISNKVFSTDFVFLNALAGTSTYDMGAITFLQWDYQLLLVTGRHTNAQLL